MGIVAAQFVSKKRNYCYSAQGSELLYIAEDWAFVGYARQYLFHL